MRLRILSIGRDRGGHFQALFEDYLGRLAHYLPVEAIVAGESQGEDGRARASEARLLRRKLTERERFVALDERGELLSSPQLAERFNAESRRGTNRLSFVLAGASGFDPTLLAQAGWRLSLSPLTLPHQLARVVLAEQLYRAQTILRGEPYSK